MAEIKAWTYRRHRYPDGLHKSAFIPQRSLAATEIEIRVHSCSLNPVDVQLMNLPIWSLPFMGYEKVVGCDFSGTVLRAGADTPYSRDDEVFGMRLQPGNGSLREVMTLDVTSPALTVARKPVSWSHNQAAAIPLVFLTARTCIAYAEPYLGPSKLVAVLGGSSSSGAYTIRLAKARGWKVIATCSTRNVEFVKSVGADEVIDYTHEDVPQRLRAALPDVIVDCVGGTQCIGLAPRYITIVGDKRDRTVMGGSALYLTSPRMVLRWLIGRLGFGPRYDCIVLAKKAEYLQEALELKPEDIVIDRVFSFDEVPAAYERLISGRGRGKIVIEVAS